MRTTFSLATVLAAITLWACGGEPDRRPGTSAGTPATTELPPADRTTLRLVALEPLNASGVRGVARLLVDGKRLAVAANITGESQRQVHMQHVHLPAGNADGRCPTAALDADGDGVVTLEEGAPAYGPPAVSLEPFPKPEGPAFGYANTLAAPRGLELDRAVVVLHGRAVRGEYEPLLPIACGEIGEAEVREIVLDPINDSTVAGTARLARAGDELLAWVSLGGPIEGREHMQHIHVPEGKAAGTCPTLEQDENSDGIVSLEEGAPAYGAPALALEPFPQPREVVFQYAQRLRVDEALPLDRGVIVVHGMDVGGSYDPTVPVACGAIDPTLPRAGHAGGDSAGVGAYGP